jgi:hypothetical protein
MPEQDKRIVQTATKPLAETLPARNEIKLNIDK